MTTFAEAVANQTTTTENGMKAWKDTSNALTDLFFAIGASRGKDIIPTFVKAYVENQELAIRIALWARDIRGGAGEREIFKQILNWLEVNDPSIINRVIAKIPELGRWDDGYCLKTDQAKATWYNMVGDAIRNGQYAKKMLSNFDTISEEKCQQILDLKNLNLDFSMYHRMINTI